MSTRKANKALTDSPTSSASSSTAVAVAATTPPTLSPSTPSTVAQTVGSEHDYLKPPSPVYLRPATPPALRPATPAVTRPGTPAIWATSPTTTAKAAASIPNIDIVPELKRPRRSTVRASAVPPPPSWGSSVKKKPEPDLDETSSTGGDVEDDKSVKSEGDTPSTVSDSPLRSSRRRKAAAEKIASIAAAKKPVETPKTTKRVLRRNSTGKFETPSQPEVKKRPVRKAAFSTSETSATTANSKRRRTNSTRHDDDIKQPEKMIKLEVVEPKDEEENLKLLVDEADSKDSELVEVVAIKQEVDGVVTEVPMEDGFLKDPPEEELLTGVEEPGKEEDDKQEVETESPSVQSTKNEKSLKDEVVKKVPANQRGGKKASSESGSQKKAAVKKDDVKQEKDSKYEAYERPRRVCQRKILDLPQTPQKRTLRKTEKQSDASIETKGKSNRRSQTKANITPETGKKAEAASKVKIEPSEEVIAAKEENVSISPEVVVANGVDDPLTVDTASANILTDKNPPSSSSEQSGDSEGINIISVQKFYKKPEFLENNVGIEKDPKLGEIIQEAEKSKDLTTSCAEVVNSTVDEKTVEDPRSPSCSGDSLKESERLVLEDSTEDDGIIKAGVEETLDTSTEEPEIGISNVEEDESSQFKGSDDIHVENEETISNSATTENVDALKTICDSTNVNTAVDDEEEGAKCNEDEQDGDTGIKDNTACNTEDRDEEVDDKESTTKIETKSPEDIQMDEISCSNEGEEELINNSEPTAMEVDTEELSPEAVQAGELNGEIDEKPDTKDILKIEGITEIAADADESMQAADDVKESKENIKNCMNTPKKIEKIDVITAKEVKDKKLLETPETLKQKENHLKNLGLLTHKAAVEAKIEKQRRRKLLQNTTTGASGSGRKSNGNGGNGSSSSNGNSSSSSESSRSSNGSSSGQTAAATAAGNCNKNSQEYTGTLKTVIKLNRQSNGSTTSSDNNNKRKSAGAAASGSNGSSNGGNAGGGGGRQSLKMTFQKGRGRVINSEKDTNQSTNTGEDTYYTIQNETEGAPQQQDAVAHGRKSHNRYHTTDATSTPAASDPIEKMDAKEIVIPEKASSFGIHPGRLCQDQCFYCGGRFGLYDTPCHVAQLKSVERQKKILENEEKLTVDNCLCDACFRHVDRRANQPNSYKKRSSAPASIQPNNNTATGDSSQTTNPQEDVSMEYEAGEQSAQSTATTKNICFMPGCNGEAVHSLRRKNIRKTIKKILPNFDLSSIGCMAPTCAKHLDAIVQVLGCALCKRRLVNKNQMYINHESERLEKILAEQGIPAKLGTNTAVCKLCRYFTSLLLKPPDIGKVQKKQFVKNYRKRLLHFYNVQAEATSDGEELADEKNEDNDDKPDGQRKVEKRMKKKKSISTAQELVEGEKGTRTGASTPQSSEDGQTLCATTSGQMVLDNDVMVDYDMPVPISDSPSPPPLPSKLQTILQSGLSNKDDISIVLRSNPNISMRELFPGEEEMGLQINVPFGNSTSVRTPEGWTRVNTFLQYDEPTRHLWEELQKPYGNQSSFLRHLILLEKFFRNGDLILSQTASSNAVVYSDSVQNRLRSYDNLSPPHKSGKSRTTRSGGSSQNTLTPEKISKRFGNLPVTITAKPKNQGAVDQGLSGTNSSSSSSSSSGSGNANSILKTNLLANNRSIEILPIGGGDSANATGSSSGLEMRSSTGGMTRQQKLLEAATRLINSQENVQVGGGHKRSGSAPAGSIPPELISIGRNQSGNHSQMKNRQMQMHSKAGSSKSSMISPNVIVLPDTLTPLERMQSKNWRPTLVPVNSVNPGAHLHSSGPLYQTADGRRLPALVQVQSGGKPYLISIHDYNRMCILRREKLMREQMLKGNKKSTEESSGKGGGNNQKSQNFQHKVQIPNKILEQNSLIPVQNRQQSGDQKSKRQPQQSLLKSASVNSLIPIAPKSQGQLPIIPPSIASQQHAIMLNQNNATIANNSSVSILPTISSVLTLAAPTTSSANTSGWPWSTPNEGNALNGNLVNKLTTGGSSSGSSSSSSSPSALKHQGNAGAIVFDNAVLSKIPKSLTVIPQKKSQGRPRGNSGDDLTSA